MQNFEFCGTLNKLIGTPNLLLRDFFEKKVLEIFVKQNPTSSFKDVLPAEPVIAILVISSVFLMLELIVCNLPKGFLA